MKSIKLVVVMVFLAVQSFSLLANTNAKISSILVYEQGDLVYIYPAGGVKNPPACHGSNGDYISFRMSRPRADVYISALMAAMVAGKVVEMWTEGACIDQSVSETLRYFRVNS